MGFGGGGTPSAELPPVVSETVALMLFGKGGEGATSFSWALPEGFIGDESAGPSILKSYRDDWRTYAGGNPYEDVAAYDPDAALVGMIVDKNNLLGQVKGIEPSVEVKQFFSEGVTEAKARLTPVNIGSLLPDAFSAARASASSAYDDVIGLIDAEGWRIITDRAVASFTSRARKSNDEVVRRFENRYASLGGVNSSAFVFGRALLERDLQDRIAEFESNLIVSTSQRLIDQFFQAVVTSMQNYLRALVEGELRNDRNQLEYGLRHASVAADMRMRRLGLMGNVLEIGNQVGRMQLIAEAEEFDKNLEYEVKETLWDLDVAQGIANLVSSTTGAAIPLTPQPSRAQTALAGGFAGASIGAQHSPAGALIGGAIGLIGGAIAG